MPVAAAVHMSHSLSLQGTLLMLAVCKAFRQGFAPACSILIALMRGR